MLSNARGKHSSPGVYIEEIDMPYASKSLGVTTLGVVGETLKGPAFEPIRISDWNEFQEYFGGTSTEKYKGNQYPKYELPYIAKSYLEQSKQLEVCRVLGFSGYNAGRAWYIQAYTDKSDTTPKIYTIGVLRSKASYNQSSSATTSCNEGDDKYDVLEFIADKVEFYGYTSYSSSNKQCQTSINTIQDELVNGLVKIKDNEYGKLTLKVTRKDSEIENIPVSLNPADKDYIINVLGTKPDEGDYSIFVEELYDNSFIKAVDSDLFKYIAISNNDTTREDYYESFRYASTPWFVSELKGNDLKKLFRFHTISDGDCSNYQVKISIANILPDEGLFDVIIRDFNDTDATPIVLERYTKCNLKPGDSNYIGLKIGTTNGDYTNKSKYVTIEIIENNTTENCVPCGFLGYPRTGNDLFETIISYNTNIYDMLKYNKQYFGVSDLSGIDADLFKYKGKLAYDKTLRKTTSGFHLDSLVSSEELSGLTVDGVTGYTFDTVSKDLVLDKTEMPRIGTEDMMSNNIYADKRLRKFTCCFYGGFDGWDIYREERTNTNQYKANKYKGIVGDNKAFNNVFTEASTYGLTGKVINSDYYAYLAAYKQFENPSKIKINLLATPGIDYVNNTDLVNEVLDIVEESRQGDCLYIVTTPDTQDGAFIEPDEAVANLEGSELNTSYAATFYPWVKYYDATNKKYINLPVTKDVVRNFAYTDNISQPWFASAGLSRGNVDCVKATLFTKLEDEDVLYEGMINPVKSFSADGVKIWGNKTMYFEDTPLNRINVRRLMIRIKDLVMSASKQLIFEQNDNTIEQQFRSIIDPILADAKQKRGISDYKIKTDTSAEARDRKELPAKIWVKPINCLEYIPISFVITPEGSSFED